MHGPAEMILRSSKSLDKLNIFNILGGTRAKRETHAASNHTKNQTKPVTSACCVCDSVLRFAADSTCFRCTICDTINDLKNSPVDDFLRPFSISELRELRRSTEDAVAKQRNYELLVQRISVVFTSTRCLNESFSLPRSKNAIDFGIDLEAVREMYELFAPDHLLMQFLLQTTANLLKRPGKKIRQVHDARFLFILLENPQLKYKRHEAHARAGRSLLGKVLGLISSLPNEVHQFMVIWFSQLPTGRLLYFVDLINSFLSNRLGSISKHKSRTYHSCWQVKAAARTMALLFAANRGRLSVHQFYNNFTDYIDFEADYIVWKNRRERFSFCQYPFFITLKQKQRILSVDAWRQQSIKVREAYFASLDSGRNETAVFELRIRRKHLLEDSLREIPAHENDLKKKLIVSFVGEEGVDAGGLRKEYFLLLCRQLFDSKFGLFNRDEDSKFCWFAPRLVDKGAITSTFFLLGVVLGLAIYNSTILDVQLPPALFKKLVGQTCGLADLKILYPALGTGLQQLLDYDGDVEATFCRNFVIEERHGNILRSIPLFPNGDYVPVNNSNRKNFVDLYVRHILYDSCSRQMFHLSRGFHQVAGGNALSLLRAEEIELLVRGSPEPLNTVDLKSVCLYDGFERAKTDPLSNSLIRGFWEVVDRMTPARQRRLLSFITGSDRIPATGTTDLKFRISVDSHISKERLPVAHTCFSQIILPLYDSVTELEEKLIYAIEEGAQAFTIA